MQHTGTLFLSKTKPETTTHEGQFALVLLLMDNLGKQGLEPYRVRWTGPEAEAFWNTHRADLVPGAVLQVELSNVRAFTGTTYPPMPELRARVVSMKYCPKRSPEERKQLSNQEHPAHAAA